MSFCEASFERGIVFLVSATSVAATLLGCSSSNGAGTGGSPEAGSGGLLDGSSSNDAGSDALLDGSSGNDASTDGGPDAGSDALLDGSSSNDAGTDGNSDAGPDALSYPAFTPAMPQIVKGGSLPVISSPMIVPVYFSGDSLQSALDTELGRWPASPAFQALSEYGIHSASIGTSIVLSETPATTLTAQQVQTWIEGKLDGTHPEFGAVDATTLASEVFVVYYPPATNVTWYSVPVCQNDFNAGVTLSSGAVANYVVVAECGTPPSGASETDTLAGNAIFGVVSQIASPDPKLQPYPSNWEFFDTGHAANATVAVASVQLAGACFLSRFTPVGTGLNATSLWLDAGIPQDAWMGAVWSNQAAAAYHDPCRPDLPGAYFVSVPVAQDQVQVKLQPYLSPMVVNGTGVLVPVGTTKTVDVDLLSDGPTSGPWTVSTQILQGAGFTFAFDRTTGQNGDVLHLAITAQSTAQQATVALYSTLGDRRTFYVFPVQSM
jgi:hypothetical protein